MIETDIELALISLCEGRISPLITKPGTETKYITYIKKKETFLNVFDGTVGHSRTFKINVFAEDMKQADQIKQQAYENLKVLRPFNVVGGQTYDSEKALFCATLEFTL